MKTFQSFSLDEVNQCLWRGDVRVSLMPKPFAVLRYLVDHAGRLVTHDELLTAIWPNTYVQPEVLRRYVLEIRRVLDDRAEKPQFVETLPKRGYRFIASVSETLDSFPTLIPPNSTKLVGRESALSQLDSYLRKALGGQRQVVFISGEPGIGKTSLVDAFQQRLERSPDIRVCRGQSVEGFGGKEAYYPILEAISQLARGRSGAEIVDVLTAQAPTWLVQLPSLVNAVEHDSLKRRILGATRVRMVRELCEALEVITRTATLVLILEDLHWADHSTADLISAVARRREPAKLLVLGTLRPADLILFQSPFKTLKQDLLLHRLSHELPLERLDESDVADYLAVQFSGGDWPPELATIINRHSDGNPLFMTAMLDHLTQQGVLSRIDGCWQLTIPLEQVDPGVPETLRQMLEVQLQHLSSSERQLLKCASVAGQYFTAWSVATMMAQESATVEDQCSELAERQQFLKSYGLQELPDGTLTFAFEFRHWLYRDALYRRLSPSQRVTFHRRLGEALARVRTPEHLEAAAEIALHFEEGREYQPAIQYLLLAAENATRRYAHRESVQALEHALELLPKIEREQRQELDVKILEKLGDAHYALGDMERSAATYHAMATHAAEAGLLTVQANALMRLAHSAEAIPFFLRAIELDPKFASAYVSLSRIYSNLGEVERAKEYASKAYEHVEDVNERERLSIIYQYHFEVTGNQTLATNTLNVWRQSFPEEFQPPNSLAFILNILGQFEQAIEQGNEAVRRNPTHGFPYSNLAHARRGLGQFAEAQAAAERAVALNIETLPTRRLLYQLAVLAGDHEAAARHVEWARDKPREFEIVVARAQVAACYGKLREARQLYEQTVEMAETRNLREVATNHLAWASWMEMIYDNREIALQRARNVLNRKPSHEPHLRAALTLCCGGFTEEAQKIVHELAAANQQHTIINLVLAPIVKAGIALARKDPAQAIEELQVVAPYELGFCAALAPIHLRGESYLLLGAGVEAAQQFQRIIDHRGSEPFSPFYALANLGLARALRVAGDINVSLQAYRRFLNDWADADPDIPILLTARREYRELESHPKSQATWAPS